MSHTVPVDSSSSSSVSSGVSRRAWLWPAAAVCVALLPFLSGLTGSRVFYIRDLSLYFWGRYLWLRQAWLSGEFPLWDPYVGAGQAAYSDALHQMFLPPAILARLVGGDVLGFNLWVLLPYPIAAAGACGFLARRFTAPASALGAMAFVLCGPVVSSGNFPNMSWSVAALPWVLRAADGVVSAPTPRRIAALAVAIALQCLAGEPVTVFTTAVLVSGYALTFAAPGQVPAVWNRTQASAAACAGMCLGVALAAVQMIPMAHAASLAERADTITQDLWSLRPTALLETVWLHLFGNYYESQSLEEVPWMPLMYTDREPFFFSIYFGVPLLALAVFGLAGTSPRRWRLFWVAAGFLSVVAAFGSYTPVYPILRDHVPPFGSFRFPVKYIVVAAMAVAAGAAAGWDALASRRSVPTSADGRERRVKRARLVAIGFAVVAGSLSVLFAAACVYFPGQISVPLDAFARALGDGSGEAADFMLRTVPGAVSSVAVPAFAAAGLLWLATSAPDRAMAAGRYALFALVAGDLLVKAWSINPAFDPAYVAEPEWLSYTRADPDARFNVGGKAGSTLTVLDIDAPRGYLNTPGLHGSASRAALSIQAAFYPSGWYAREMVSYDLPVLWPREYALAAKRYSESGREERDRFLDRTGVRYRVLPQWRAGARTPLVRIQKFHESFLFDWGEHVAPRVSIVPRVRVVADVNEQIATMFEDGWDSRTVTLVEREPPMAGTHGAPAEPYARFVEDRGNRAVIEAGIGAGGGYLLVLDSYSPDWRVTVDGVVSSMVRANGLFRVVRLCEGSHRIEFDYKPRALVWGASISAIALVVVIGLAGWDWRRARRYVVTPATAAEYR